MVLLDDEADDASVLDSDRSQKLTPRLIASLWSGDPDEAATRHPNLLATYVAYTYRIDVDINCSNVSRACYLPFDPDAYIYPKLLEK